MRRLLLLSTAFVLFACSDNPQTTSPRSISSESRAGDVTKVADGIRPQAKPTDQIGWTKVTKVVSFFVAVSPNSVGTVKATCPAGTTVIGGGHQVAGTLAGVPSPLVAGSEDAGRNGWAITVDNLQPGAALLQIYAIAYCAS